MPELSGCQPTIYLNGVAAPGFDFGVGFPLGPKAAQLADLPRWMLKAIDGAEAPSSVDRVAFGAQMWKKGYGRLPAFGLPTSATADTKEPDWYWNTLANPSSPFWHDPKYPRRQIDHDYALAHRLFWRTQTTSFPALDWVASKVTGHDVRITTDDIGRALKAGLPLVQTVISFVPGIGQGVNMAIAAGGALLAGESLTDAAIASVKGALPGGPAAAYAFDAATKVMKGERIDKAALESARNLLPPGAAQQAFDIGLAVASGKKIQDIVGMSIAAIAPGQIQSVLSDAQGVISNNSALTSAFQQIPAGAAEQGFKLAAGLLKKDANTTNTKTMAEVREQLPPDVQAGFDAAMRAAAPPPPPVTTSAPSMRKLSPEDIKRIQANVKAAADLAALAKLTPEQQKQLVAQAAAEKAKADAAKTAPPKMVTPPRVTPKPTPAPTAPVKTTPAGAKVPSQTPAAPPAPAPAAAGRYAPYPSAVAVSTGVSGACDAPAAVLGAPITDMPPEMHRAGMAAVYGSKGRPRSVRAPNGAAYRFSLENGRLVARPHIAA